MSEEEKNVAWELGQIYDSIVDRDLQNRTLKLPNGKVFELTPSDMHKLGSTCTWFETVFTETDPCDSIEFPSDCSLDTSCIREFILSIVRKHLTFGSFNNSFTRHAEFRHAASYFGHHDGSALIDDGVVFPQTDFAVDMIMHREVSELLLFYWSYHQHGHKEPFVLFLTSMRDHKLFACECCMVKTLMNVKAMMIVYATVAQTTKQADMNEIIQRAQVEATSIQMEYEKERSRDSNVFVQQRSIFSREMTRFHDLIESQKKEIESQKKEIAALKKLVSEREMERIGFRVFLKRLDDREKK
jgi:hypothetical protein